MLEIWFKDNIRQHFDTFGKYNLIVIDLWKIKAAQQNCTFLSERNVFKGMIPAIVEQLS